MAGTQDPSLADVIAEWVKAGIADIHTAMPAVVVVYDQTTQKATVQPVIRQRVDDVLLDIQRPDLAPIPPISNVPVIWPSGLTWAHTGPLAPGAPVTLVFVERSTDEWRAVGAPDGIAQDARRFDLADAVAFPGGRSFNPLAATTGPIGATLVDPAAQVIGTTILGGVKLGSNVAVDGVLKGTLFEADLLAKLAAEEIFITGVSTATTAAQIAALAVTYLPSLVAFKATVSSGLHRSLKVLVE